MGRFGRPLLKNAAGVVCAEESQVAETETLRSLERMMQKVGSAKLRPESGVICASRDIELDWSLLSGLFDRDAVLAVVEYSFAQMRERETKQTVTTNLYYLRYLTSSHLTSLYLTSPYLTSPHLTLPYLTSP